MRDAIGAPQLHLALTRSHNAHRSQSKPILTFLEDTGPGVHDTTVAACSHELYEEILGIGPSDFHDSCTTNLHEALAKLRLKLTDDPLNFYVRVLRAHATCAALTRCACAQTPGPFNLWMNVPLRSTAATTFEEWCVERVASSIIASCTCANSATAALTHAARRWAGPHPDQKPGDYVVFRAEQDCVAVMSACPSSDISPLNGPTGKSHDIHYMVLSA